jgi:hypothetical protein
MFHDDTLVHLYSKLTFLYLGVGLACVCAGLGYGPLIVAAVALGVLKNFFAILDR